MTYPLDYHTPSPDSHNVGSCLFLYIQRHEGRVCHGRTAFDHITLIVCVRHERQGFLEQKGLETEMLESALVGLLVVLVPLVLGVAIYLVVS